MNTYYVYILSNRDNKVFYVGVTSNLVRRVYEHKNKFVDGFSSKYKLNKLIYFERTNDISVAIEKEKKLKKWKREWKERIINKYNPEWKDLYNEITS